MAMGEQARAGRPAGDCVAGAGISAEWPSWANVRQDLLGVGTAQQDPLTVCSTADPLEVGVARWDS